MICDRDDMTRIPRFHPNCLHHFILMITESPGCIKATRRWFRISISPNVLSNYILLCVLSLHYCSRQRFILCPSSLNNQISLVNIYHMIFFFFRFIIFTFLSSFIFFYLLLSSFIFKISQLKIFDKFLIICD